jgi:tetratricopeptide (TPR) repeat protein
MELLGSKLPLAVRSIRSLSNKSFIYLSVIESNLILGRFREAIKVNEEMKKDSYCSRYYDEGLYTIGRYYEKAGNLDAAVDFYRRAVEASYDNDDGEKIRDWAQNGIERMIQRSAESGETPWEDLPDCELGN